MRVERDVHSAAVVAREEAAIGVVLAKRRVLAPMDFDFTRVVLSAVCTLYALYRRSLLLSIFHSVVIFHHTLHIRCKSSLVCPRTSRPL